MLLLRAIRQSFHLFIRTQKRKDCSGFLLIADRTESCTPAADSSPVVPDGWVPLSNFLWCMQGGRRYLLYWQLVPCRLKEFARWHKSRGDRACAVQLHCHTMMWGANGEGVTGTPEDDYSHEPWQWRTSLRPHCMRGRHWAVLADSLSFRCLQMISARHFVKRNWHPQSAVSKPQGRVRLSWKTKH